MSEPNRGGHLWCGLQSQGQKDGYDMKHVGTFVLMFLLTGYTIIIIIIKYYFCR